jgi:PAS domain-containing protein
MLSWRSRQECVSMLMLRVALLARLDRTDEEESLSMSSEADAITKDMLVEQAPDAMIFADRHGLIRTWNPAAERIFGHSAAAAIGQTLDIIIPDVEVDEGRRYADIRRAELCDRARRRRRGGWRDGAGAGHH